MRATGEPDEQRAVALARGLARAPSDTALLRRWLTANATDDGVTLDPESRWAVLRRLAELGGIEAPEIEAERSGDGTAAGELGAVTAPAARRSRPYRDRRGDRARPRGAGRRDARRAAAPVVRRSGRPYAGHYAESVTDADDIEPYEVAATPDLRIGTPEREDAKRALEAHLLARRLDEAELERRLTAVDAAVTRGELRMVFGDLPVPHPVLPAAAPAPPTEPEDDMPPLAAAGCLALGLGVPVAVVLGFVYGAWWSLVVPVVVPVVLAYLEHLRTANRP